MFVPDPEIVPVLTVAEAHELVGRRISRSAFYEAIRRDQIPSIRVGRKILIPTAKFREWAGMDEKPSPPLDDGYSMPG